MLLFFCKIIRVACSLPQSRAGWFATCVRYKEHGCRHLHPTFSTRQADAAKRARVQAPARYADSF